MLVRTQASGFLRRFFSLSKNGEEDRGQNRDDGDHDQEFDEGKRFVFHEEEIRTSIV